MAKLIVIDSLGPAAGKELNFSDAPIELYAALRSLRCFDGSLPTIFILAHHSKGEGETKTIYGSVFFKNLSRSVWELRKEQEPGTNELLVGLFHRDANDIGISKPMGFRLYFGEKETTIESGDLQDSTIRDTHLITERIFSALRHGPLTRNELAEEIGEKPDSVSVLLTRLRKAQKVVRVGDRTWGLVSYETPEAYR